MTKPFTKMLAELNTFLGNKIATPSTSNDIDALDDQKDDPEGGMELPPEDQSEDDLPNDDQITDLDDTETDLSKLSLDQIIAALLALKASQEGEKDLGGEKVEPHSDFADQDPNAPPEHINPADNRMPDEGQIDDESIPSLPGLRPSVEDEQLSRPVAKKNPFGADEEDDDTVDPKGATFDSFDTDPEDGSEADPEETDPDALDASTQDGGLGSDSDESQGLDDLVKGDEADSDQPDENHMGTLRTVKGAHLVYKRQAGDGTFSELWSYNIGDHIDDAISIKKAIIAGTDIGENKLRSDDGSQSYELVTLGNAQLLKITGLPN